MNLKNQRELIIRAEYEKLVFGEVYLPMRADTYKTAMTPEEIRRVAYDFMRRGLINRIDQMHDQEESGCYVVESFIARKDDPDGFVEGAWVIGVQVTRDDIWEKVLSGKYNGFSIFGDAIRETEPVTLIRITEMELETELSPEGVLPPHSHYVHLFFDDDHRVVPTWTGEELGHSHPVMLTTATELDDAGFEHNHRFVVSE